ncbi:MAG: Grx4 family monothiol glutaredoxin [Gammaproteobacteria bacterium]|nr:Grx4 family monothiol glutaredoxin [Gammaproteobacteria bacterium]
MTDIMETIKQQVEGNPVVIYMKGTPQFPMCGFSSRASQALSACGEEYLHVNIFDNEEIYRNLPSFSDWPTFPQVFIGGELVGGCDIVLQLYQQGELLKMVKEAVKQNHN